MSSRVKMQMKYTFKIPIPAGTTDAELNEDLALVKAVCGSIAKALGLPFDAISECKLAIEVSTRRRLGGGPGLDAGVQDGAASVSQRKLQSATATDVFATLSDVLVIAEDSDATVAILAAISVTTQVNIEKGLQRFCKTGSTLVPAGSSCTVEGAGVSQGTTVGSVVNRTSPQAMSASSYDPNKQKDPDEPAESATSVVVIVSVLFVIGLAVGFLRIYSSIGTYPKLGCSLLENLVGLSIFEARAKKS